MQSMIRGEAKATAYRTLQPNQARSPHRETAISVNDGTEHQNRISGQLSKPTNLSVATVLQRMETTGLGQIAPKPFPFALLPENVMLNVLSYLNLQEARAFVKSERVVRDFYHRKFSASTEWGVFWITEKSYYEGITNEQHLRSLRRPEEQLKQVPEIHLRKKIGVSIKIEFVASPKVSATKIGLVQTVQGYIDGKPFASDEYKQKLSVVSTEGGYTTHIDRIKEELDPMYAAASERFPKVKAKPGFGTADPKWGAWGTNATNATLIDEPLNQNVLGASHCPTNVPNSGQEFETSALALEGEQAGQYYGSVGWGWKTDDHGNFEVLPLRVISTRSVSPTFAKAAEKWNKGNNTKAARNRQLPIPN